MRSSDCQVTGAPAIRPPHSEFLHCGLEAQLSETGNGTDNGLGSSKWPGTRGRDQASGAPRRGHEAAVRVLVADDHPVVRRGLREALEESPHLAVVGEAEDSDEVLRKARELSPDVVLLDFKMPGLSPTEVVRSLKTLPHPPQVLVISAYGDASYVIDMIQAGADGYLLKGEHLPSLREAVLRVSRGGPPVLSDALYDTVFAEFFAGRRAGSASVKLTEREREVLRLVARGYDNRQIASELGISPRTVKNHVNALYEKVDVHSRAALVAWAWQHGFGPG